eukprot:411518-Rhodomonas_salina.2
MLSALQSWSLVWESSVCTVCPMEYPPMAYGTDVLFVLLRTVQCRAQRDRGPVTAGQTEERRALGRRALPEVHERVSFRRTELEGVQRCVEPSLQKTRKSKTRNCSSAINTAWTNSGISCASLCGAVTTSSIKRFDVHCGNKKWICGKAIVLAAWRCIIWR